MRRWSLTAALLILVLVFAGLAPSSVGKRIVMPPGAKPGGNYSPGIMIGDGDGHVEITVTARK